MKFDLNSPAKRLLVILLSIVCATVVSYKVGFSDLRNLETGLVLLLTTCGFYFITYNLLSFWVKSAETSELILLQNTFSKLLWQNNQTVALAIDLVTLTVEEMNDSATANFGDNLQEHQMKLSCLFTESDYQSLIERLQLLSGDTNSQTLETSMLVENELNRTNLIPANLTVIKLKPPNSADLIERALIFVEFDNGKLNYSKTDTNVNSRINTLKYKSDLAYWEIAEPTGALYFSEPVAELMGLDESFQSPLFLSKIGNIADTAIFELTRQYFSSFLESKSEIASFNAQKMIIARNGEQKFVQVNATYLPEDKLVVGTFYDLTDIKSREIKLRQQDQQLNQLIDSIPESIIVFQRSKVVFWNHAATRQFKIDSQQNMSLSKIVSEADKPIVHDRIKFLLSGKKSSYGFTYVNMKRYDGKLFEAELAMNLIIYEGIESIQFIIRDLTDVLRVKNALTRANNRLSALSSRTLELIEKERKQIAGELHDDVGQSMTAMILGMNWLRRRVEAPELSKKIEDMHQIATQSLDKVRNLSLLLRPSQLDTLGFSAAILWQMERLFSVSGIKFELLDDEFVELSDKQAEIVGFRVIQESLTNIVKHAEAKNVKVTLRSDNDVLIIQVSDDGIGFDVNEQSESVGLVNMKERVELANGEFTIMSRPYLGTDIKVEIPLLNNNQRLHSEDKPKD